MPLETFAWDALDFIKDDAGLASLLDDALETRHEAYISDVVSDIERAKGLSEDPHHTLMLRVMRAAEAVGAKVAISPITSDDRQAA